MLNCFYLDIKSSENNLSLLFINQISIKLKMYFIY